MAKQRSVTYLPLVFPIACTAFAVLYLPIVILVFYAFNSGTSVSGWQGFSLRWFVAAWNDPAVFDAALRSLGIAAVSAVIAVLVAIPAALAMSRTQAYRGQAFKESVLNVPLLVPEIVMAVGLLILFSRVKLWTGYQGIGYIVLAHAAFCVPFAYMPLRARLQGMDTALEHAARDLYASRWQAFRYVTLPLIRPAIIAGGMLAFVISLDDVVITEFIKSGGQETIPTYMLGQIRRGVTPQLNAIATVFLALSIAFVTVFYLATRNTDDD
ncbi:MAG: ABC transporter permease [Rhizobium sp.]|nr:ABC transporter permease [Rhizobium sp.]